MPTLEEYLDTHSTPRDTSQFLDQFEVTISEMFREVQVSAAEGALLALLVHLTDARRVIEVGTFRGYSTTYLARAMPADGRVLTCDLSENAETILARFRWLAAGVLDKIDLRIGPALDTLRSLPLDYNIDLSFIDADKLNYQAYYEELVPRTRPGGLVVVDDVLWYKGVLDPENPDPTTRSFQQLNAHIVTDSRVESVMLPLRNGLTICRKL